MFKHDSPWPHRSPVVVPPRPSCEWNDRGICVASNCTALKTSSHNGGSQIVPAMVVVVAVGWDGLPTTRTNERTNDIFSTLIFVFAFSKLVKTKNWNRNMPLTKTYHMNPIRGYHLRSRAGVAVGGGPNGGSASPKGMCVNPAVPPLRGETGTLAASG